MSRKGTLVPAGLDLRKTSLLYPRLCETWCPSERQGFTRLEYAFHIHALASVAVNVADVGGVVVVLVVLFPW